MDQPWESSRLGEPEEEPGLPRAPHCPRVKKWSEAVCPSCFSCCCLGAQSASDSLRPHGLQPPGFSVRGISQARILEWVVSSFSRGSSRPRDRTQVSCTAGGFFTSRATREALYNKIVLQRRQTSKKMVRMEHSLDGKEQSREFWKALSFQSFGSVLP